MNRFVYCNSRWTEQKDKDNMTCSSCLSILQTEIRMIILKILEHVERCQTWCWNWSQAKEIAIVNTTIFLEPFLDVEIWTCQVHKWSRRVSSEINLITWASMLNFELNFEKSSSKWVPRSLEFESNQVTSGCMRAFIGEERVFTRAMSFVIPGDDDIIEMKSRRRRRPLVADHHLYWILTIAKSES